MATEEIAKAPDKREIAACGDDHGLAVWFTPDAIKQHFESGDAEDEAIQAMPDELLAEAAHAAMDNDLLWRIVGDMMQDIVEDAKKIAAERAKAAPPGAA